ncbi:Uncharacterized conserved protein, contains HEPN domain [Ensifer adhaerens]|nr:Uncharacterized conserved protein, contains HEPN domain [Ensifer adhaerens]
MTNTPRVLDYLEHMLAAIDRIGRYTTNLDEASFLRDELVQDAVIRNIEIIGEASNNIQRADPGFAARQGDIPWLVLYTMRNRVAHGYHKVDLEIVWKTIKGDLPNLYAKVSSARESLLHSP